MELYREDLAALDTLLDHVGDVGAVEGVFEAEIRVRLNDATWWAVIGYGEAGDPCVLRFEKDPAPVTITYPNIHVNPTPSPFTTTINQLKNYDADQ